MAAADLDERKKKKLVHRMVNRRLQYVKDDYVNNREVRELRIPRTGDTALHVAASDGWEYYAEEMVSAAERDELAIGNVQGDTALHIPNEQGDTALNLPNEQGDAALHIRNVQGDPALHLPNVQGDAALHIRNVQWDAALHLPNVQRVTALHIRNVQGDTALHMAAKSGSAFFCRCIAEKDVTLVGEKNESGETPLFSAVSRGHTEAFLYLHHLCKEKAPEILDKPETYTRKDGDTILHSAIFEGHYDLAYIIALKYLELVQQPNSDGLLPLHLLATRPEAFPSGLHFSRIHELLFYHWEDFAKKIDLDKAPNPQLGWKAFFRPLEAHATIFQKAIYWIQKETREEDGGAANIQVHGEINQEDEEAANIQDKPTIQSWIRHCPRKIMLGCFYLLILPIVICSICVGLCDILGSWCFEKLIRTAIELVKKFSDCPTIRGKIMLGCFYLLILPVALPIIIVLCICSLCIPLGSRRFVTLIRTLIRIAIVLVKKFSGYNEFVRVKHMMETCLWSEKLMRNLIKSYEKSPPQEHQSLDQLGISPAQEHQSLESTIKPESSKEDEKSAEAKIKIVEKPMFDAAKHGISEMVFCILFGKPDEIFDVNAEKKNIVMLAVEHRHNHLYNNLMNYGRINKTVLEQVDKDGNNLLHIAAYLEKGKQFWRIRGAALHMHMEIKWYEYVKKSMPTHLVQGRNNSKQTPKEILQYSHKDLIKEGRLWLIDTSQSCSLVAALIATVSFAASATVPGGLKQDTGVPSLENKPIFIASAISALIALSSSMISVVMFLSILTSSFKLQDFHRDLPFKLLWGLVSLLISIFSMIISFFAGHYFVLKQEFNHQAALVYEILCSILVALILYTFPLEFEIVRSTISTKPTK